MLKFLTYCAGTRWDVLEKCPGQKTLYASLGAAILLTSVLAFISGSYALYMVFGNVNYALAFGLVWAVTIFNLDRLIVMSMRKRADTPWWKYVLQAIPRIILAVFISLVIAKPLEVRLFQAKLKHQLTLDMRDEKKELKKYLDNVFSTSNLDSVKANASSTIADLEDKKNKEPNTFAYTEAKSIKKDAETNYNTIKRNNEIRIRSLNNEINEIRQDPDYVGLDVSIPRDSLRKIQADGRIQTKVNKIIVLRREIRNTKAELERETTALDSIKQAYYDGINEDIKSSNEEVAKLNEQLDSIKFDRETEELIQEGGIEEGYTAQLLPYINALGNLTKRDETMAITSLLITLLFIALETAPVLAKLLLPRTLYEEMLETKEKEELSNANDEANMRFDHLHQLHEELTQKKGELIGKAIDHIAEEKWKDQVDDIDSESKFQKFIEDVSKLNLQKKKRQGLYLSYRTLLLSVLSVCIAALLFLADFDRVGAVFNTQPSGATSVGDTIQVKEGPNPPAGAPVQTGNSM